jgi:hypothetical protein
MTDNLGGPGFVGYDPTLYPTANNKRAEITDYIRMRLADGIVDVELEKDHYEMGIKQALIKYRQKAQNATEESHVFLDLQPEVQEYILPKEIMVVRQVLRRGIGSITGQSASQFEPFASGFLNTYMLVAGRVGGLTNYELFTQYQKQAMTMFGGYIDFQWEPVTKKLTLVRKIPASGHKYIRMTALYADGLTQGSTITIETEDIWQVNVQDTITISNCKIGGYNNNYQIQSVDQTQHVFTVVAKSALEAQQVVTHDLRTTTVWSPTSDVPSETVMLRVYNSKPDQMLLNDTMIFPWIQEYAYAFCKRILGEAREKFATIAGPQGGTQLNGASLKAESVAEMEKLEEDLKNMVDGSWPLTWVIG